MAAIKWSIKGTDWNTSQGRKWWWDIRSERIGWRQMRHVLVLFEVAVALTTSIVTTLSTSLRDLWLNRYLFSAFAIQFSFFSPHTTWSKFMESFYTLFKASSLFASFSSLFAHAWSEYARLHTWKREGREGEGERAYNISPLATQWTLVMIRNGSPEREEITHTFGAAASLTRRQTNAA